MYKRSLALFLVLCFCLLALCSCGGAAIGPDSQSTAPTDAYQPAQDPSSHAAEPPNPTPTAAATEEAPDPTPSPSENPIEFTEFTYSAKDKDGYTFDVTWRVSPWILSSNSEVLDAAWSQVGRDKSLPTEDSWSLKSFSDGSRIRRWDNSVSAASHDFVHIMNEMYYCVGSVQITNTTPGWSFSSEDSYSPEFYLPYWGIDHNNGSDTFTIGRTFYNSSDSDFPNHVQVHPRMTSDRTAAIPFVMMTPEFFSPNYPSGKYLDAIRNGYFVTTPYTMDSLWPKENDTKLYIGIYNKDGEYLPPLHENSESLEASTQATAVAAQTPSPTDTPESSVDATSSELGLPALSIFGQSIAYGDTWESVQEKIPMAQLETKPNMSLKVCPLGDNTRLAFREENGIDRVVAWMTSDAGIGSDSLVVGDSEDKIPLAYPECEDENPYQLGDRYQELVEAGNPPKGRYRLYVDTEGNRIPYAQYHELMGEAYRNNAREEFAKKYGSFMLVRVEEGKVLDISCGDRLALELNR